MSFVCFGGVDWWYHSRAHIDPQLTVRFAKKGTTLFINSIVMTKIDFSEGKRLFQKLVRKAKSIFTGLKKIEKGFWVYSPFSLPVHHIRWAKPLNDLLLRVQVWRITRRLGIHNPVVLVACPAACDVAIQMRKNKLIYQRTDRFEEAACVDAEVVKRYDRKLKARADLTYFVNKALFGEESGQCKGAMYLDHGVDFEMFSSAEESPLVPDDIAGIPRPIAGYFGAISEHSVDIALCEKIADLLPQISFVYIGTNYEDYPSLKAKKNVWFLGQKDYERIPHYGKCFDVAILPWRRNRWTEAANPIKLKEYLALGKPVVSTPAFTELESYLDVVYEATTPQEFAHCIQKACSEDNPALVNKRRQRVAQSSWDSKAELVLRELFKDNESQSKA